MSSSHSPLHKKFRNIHKLHKKSQKKLSKELTDHDVILPSCIIWKLHPRAYCLDIILGENNSFAKPTKHLTEFYNFNIFY